MFYKSVFVATKVIKAFRWVFDNEEEDQVPADIFVCANVSYLAYLPQVTELA